MQDLRRRIEADESPLEELTRHIPGFEGYKERENRRLADQILRKQFAEDLEREVKSLNDVRLQLTNQGQLELLDDLDRLGRKLGTFVDEIRYADYGFSGFFEAVKIKDDDLDRVYEYDASMAGRLVEVTEATRSLASAEAAALPPQLAAADRLVDALRTQWQDREKVMKGLTEEATQ